MVGRGQRRLLGEGICGAPGSRGSWAGTEEGSRGFWETGPHWREGLEVGLGANSLQIEGFLLILQMFI